MTVPDRPRQRVNYFTGRLLSAEDLRDEQEHVRAREWLHNQMLHGSGVITGFDVTVDGDEIVVSPGMALDGLGREIVLTESLFVDGSSVVAGSHGRVHVGVSWAEEAAGEVVGPDGPVPGHFVERPVLALFEKGSGKAADDVVVLARVHRKDDVLVADGSIRRHVRRSGQGDR